MTEQFTENVKRLEFDVVRPSDSIVISTGIEDNAWRYTFDVHAVGSTWPHGTLGAINHLNEEITPVNFTLHGCGMWTSRKQNPVQKQERGFTPYYNGLIVGSFLFGRFEGETDRAVFDKPGQEISEIIHTPYRENLMLSALASKVGPMSVREVMGFVESNTDPGISSQEITGKDIRKTMGRLAQTGHVTLLKKKVQLFELSTK